MTGLEIELYEAEHQPAWLLDFWEADTESEDMK